MSGKNLLDPSIAVITSFEDDDRFYVARASLESDAAVEWDTINENIEPRWENIQDKPGTAGSSRVVYTSGTCTSNATLEMGSSTFGTDQTAALQAILDLALDGPLKVIWDGAYSISDQLEISSNTTIEALPDCGAIIRDGTNLPVFTNANWVGTASPTDENITIIGGIWNGNRAGQADWAAGVYTTSDPMPAGMAFHGVRNLRLSRCEVRNARMFGIWAQNCQDGWFENLTIDQHPLSVTAGDTGMDGIHISGPSRANHIVNCTITSNDDAIAITNGAIHPGTGALLDWGIGKGDVSDTIIDGIVLVDCLNGIRVGSQLEEDTIRRTAIRGVTGNVRSTHWFTINDRTYPEGRADDVSVADCCIDLSGELDTGLHGISIAHTVERLRFSGLIDIGSTSLDTAIAIDSSAQIDQLIIENSAIVNSASDRSYITIDAGASINQLRITDFNWTESASGSGYLIDNAGTIAWAHIGDYMGPARLLTGTAAIFETGDAFDLTEPQAVLVQELNSDDLVLSNDDPVATWADATANHYDVAQATSGQRPVFKTNQINSLPAVRFDGVDDKLTRSDAGFPTGDFTFFAVAKCSDTYPDLDFGFCYNYGGAGAGEEIAIGFGSIASGFGTNAVFVAQSGDSTGIPSSTGAWHIIVITRTGTSYTIERSGASDVTDTMTGTTTLGGLLMIGTNLASSFPLQGDIAHIALYSGAMVGAQRAAKLAALATKYGLTAP